LREILLGDGGPVSATLIVVAAGEGSRLRADRRKALVELEGETLLERALRAFDGVDAIVERVVAAHPDDVAALSEGRVGAYLRARGGAVVPGGSSRRQSVLFALRASTSDARNVLVHDAARPFVRKDRIEALLDALVVDEAALLAAPATSTVKRADALGFVAATLPRDEIRLATTPQGGRRALLRRLLEDAETRGVDATDEASLFEAAGVPTRLVPDDATNFKVTHPSELKLARALVAATPPRVGHGYDVHRLVSGRRLVLGGVEIPSDVGLLGHSDGDALLHAIIEALLGAAGLPDIGEHFSDKDARFKDADSRVLLGRVLDELASLGLRPVQVDASILAERPRLGAWKEKIKASLVDLLDLPADRVAVKARTNEGLDAIGRGEAIAVHCVALVR
jgi:2-C-methyl-D-erythritol 4-phosphate cytidylyltransferase / 2-C-methyl-D-erythritol 2,4-cyclodiphosphate synthase